MNFVVLKNESDFSNLSFETKSNSPMILKTISNLSSKLSNL